MGSAVVGFGYDPQGNVTNKNGQDHFFDLGNRLRWVSGVESYRYDGHGRRVAAFTPSPARVPVLSMYGQSGQLLFDENQRKAGTESQEYIYLAGSLIATRRRNYASGSAEVKYHHTDALGSPVAVTDAAGKVIESERVAYEPYGAIVGGAKKQGVGYTGHVMDAATGLTYMQQRYYDPQIGRFLSVDPVAANPNTGASFNRYWYADNNPYKFTDPDGRTAKLIRPIIKVLKNGGDVRGALKETKTEIVDSVVTLLDSSASPVDKAAAIFDLASPVSSGELTKGGMMLRNALQGAIGEADEAKKLGGALGGRGVAVKTSDGKLTYVDLMKKDGTAVEVKTGNSPLSAGQKQYADDAANDRLVTPVGDSARRAGFEPGKPIPAKFEEKRL